MSIQKNSLSTEHINDEKCQLNPLARRSRPIDNTRWFVSAFLVVNATLGVSLLNFPKAYHEAGGVVAALIVQTVFLVLVLFALFIIIYCSDIKCCNTYQDMVLSICGPKAQLACAFCILLHCFGMCTTCLIIIHDQWELFFLNVARELYCTTHPFYTTRAFIISATSVLFILPLCFTKRIDFLKHSSFLGVIGCLYIAVLVAVKYFLPHDNQGKIATAPHSWIDVFLVVPNICFAYACHVTIIPIYSCMAKRNMRELSKTVTLAVIVCIIIYTTTATLGYLQFGDVITNDILLSFNPTAEVMVAVVLVAVKTYTTYPILCFCGKAAFETMWGMFWKMGAEEIVNREKTRRIITTLVWFALTLLLSIFIPNIGVIIQILGAVIALLIFVFPGLCLLKTIQNRVELGEEQPTKVRVLKGIGIAFAVLGVLIFGLTLSQTIMKDIQGVNPDSSKFTCS
ncbi:sodium-coupled neutral amino acid transporter 7-like [Physella acuta]|uniref:sodium-coupled neutral amino acid transporter 7-like n=1 Tax=Physella acuta TaxID=109671 RepID=UPI0027DB27F9|nr:sodium-coupled neutral amino acid transporter 7-like [Physella acuta]